MEKRPVFYCFFNKLREIALAAAMLGVFQGAMVVPEARAEDKVVESKTSDKPEAPRSDIGTQESVVYESDVGGHSILSRAWQGGFIVFMVLLCLVVCSVLSWAIVVAKFLHLRRVGRTNETFVKSFWESRSLNDLNGRLADHPYSPAKEVFKAGYAELVRGSHLKEQTSATQLAVNAAIENLGRALNKAKMIERKRMEKYLPILATIASASPFVGLFGTVWGIMGSFEGIARTGSASLAAVAPGISEALIATAFGLAAAIPAVVGYNLANAKIRGLVTMIDGFMADFLNIVERYLVADRKSQPNPSAHHTPLA